MTAKQNGLHAAMVKAGSAMFSGLVLGAVVGCVATLWLRSASDLAPSATVAAASREVGEVGSVASTARVDSASPQPMRHEVAAAAESREEADVISARLTAFATDEIRRGWRELRPETIPDEVLAGELASYLEQVRTLPLAAGRRAAEAASLHEKKAEAFAGTDGVALLRTIGGGEAEAAPFVASERFQALFQPHGGGATVDGTALERDGKLPQGAIVTFPAGVFALHDLSNGNEPFPEDVTVRGVGMDATLLVLDAQRARSPMQRFAVEDCTVFADNAITDVRSNPAVLSLRRVRVVGFDCGAGGCVAFYLFGGMAMSAVGCRFEGGYGRNPQSYANLMRTGGPCLVRFEQCQFDRVSLNDAAAPTVVFSGCTMNELLDQAPDGPQFANCRITVIDQEKKWDGDFRRKDLNTLFPDWQRRLQRR